MPCRWSLKRRVAGRCGLTKRGCSGCSAAGRSDARLVLRLLPGLVDGQRPDALAFLDGKRALLAAHHARDVVARCCAIHDDADRLAGMFLHGLLHHHERFGAEEPLGIEFYHADLPPSGETGLRVRALDVDRRDAGERDDADNGHDPAGRGGAGSARGDAEVVGERAAEQHSHERERRVGRAGAGQNELAQRAAAEHGGRQTDDEHPQNVPERLGMRDGLRIRTPLPWT